MVAVVVARGRDGGGDRCRYRATRSRRPGGSTDREALLLSALPGQAKHAADMSETREKLIDGAIATLRDKGIAGTLGRELHKRERDAGNVAVLAQVLAGAQQDANLAAAAQDALTLWIVEIEATLVRLLKGSPIAAVANAEGLARGIAASFIGIELFERVDPHGAESAMSSLETMGVLVEVVEDLGPVARRALRARLRRTNRASTKTVTS